MLWGGMGVGIVVVENAMGVQVGITDIPDFRTRRPSGVGLGVGKTILACLILEQGEQWPPQFFLSFCLFVFFVLLYFVIFVFFVFFFFVFFVFFVFLSFLSFCLFVFFVLLYFVFFVFFVFLTFCHHHHNHMINIYYHTICCSNPTIFQFRSRSRRGGGHFGSSPLMDTLFWSLDNLSLSLG